MVVHECDQWRKNCFNDSKGFQTKQQRELVKAAKRNNKKEERGIVKKQVVGLRKMNCSNFLKGKETNLTLHQQLKSG